MTEEIFDLPEFLERVQDDKELLLELLDIFTADFIEKRKSLGVAFTDNDYEAVRSISHSLKGASGNISAKALRETLIVVEQMGKNNDLTGGDEALKKLDADFAALSKRLENIKEELN